MQQITVWHAINAPRHAFSISTEPIVLDENRNAHFAQDAQSLYETLSKHLPLGTWNRLCELVRLHENDY